MLLAATGVVYLVDPLRADFSAQASLGNLLIVTNCAAYGAYIAISQDLFRRYGALKVITWLFAIGSAFTIGPGVYAWKRDGLQAAGLSIWIILAYIVLIPTVAAYYLNAWALTRVTPSTVATYIYLQPLFAFALAPLLLGERWNARTLTASLLIFAGVGLVTRRVRSYAAKEVTERPDALAH